MLRTTWRRRAVSYNRVLSSCLWFLFYTYGNSSLRIVRQYLGRVFLKFLLQSESDF